MWIQMHNLIKELTIFENVFLPLNGECQRVAIREALANNPSLILPDENLLSLELKSSEKVLEMLKKANEEFNTTIVIASHNSTINQWVEGKYLLSNRELSRVP